MRETNDPFQQQLKPEQHLFLFSPKSITEFLGGLGVQHIRFEKAIFDFYDMFLVASRQPFEPVDEARISASLIESPHRRFALGMLDLRRNDRIGSSPQSTRSGSGSMRLRPTAKRD